MYLCTKLAIDFLSTVLAFVSIDNIGESLPRCLSFDHYLRQNLATISQRKSKLIKKCPIFARIYGIRFIQTK